MIKFLSPDILADGVFDMSEVFDSVQLAVKNRTDEITEDQADDFNFTNLTEMKMMIETRFRYPSDKIIFTIADATKHKPIRYLNIFLVMKGQFDVDLVLEDSKRNFRSTFISSNDLIFFDT